MILYVAGDLYQISECVPGAIGHEAVCVYVLLNDGHPILVDCGSQLHRSEMMHQLETVLDGTAPEFIFLTHSELPHAGNLQKIAEKFPSIQVLVSNVMLPYIEIAPILPLNQITSVVAGKTLEFAGRKLAFLDALLRDQPGSQWIFDDSTGALFSGDGFGYYHAPGMCDLFGDEPPDGVPLKYIESYHRSAFRFLEWVIPERLGRDLEKLFQRRDVRVIAPTHGNAIRSAIPAHVERLKRAVENICLSYNKELVGYAH
jgi:flavorubredoxin